MSLPQNVKIAEDVVGEVLEGEAVLLNLRTGIYYSLNATGTQIWQLLEQHGDVGKVRSQMLEKYKVDPEVLDNDLTRLMGELIQRQLVSVTK